MRITVRRQERERGLAAVTQGPRGFDIRINGECVGHVRWGHNFGKEQSSGYWYWWAQSTRYGVPHKNTASEPSNSLELARDACRAYVREHAKEPA